MAWAWWLAAPVLATALVALWFWWRGRPRRQPDTDAAMREHQQFLDALARGPREPRSEAPTTPGRGSD